MMSSNRAAKSPGGGRAIVIRDLSVDLGEVHAIENLTVTIQAGRITAVIGPNGAGKTTLLRAILGEIPTRGKITFPRAGGKDAGGGGDGAARPAIGYVPQSVQFDRGVPVTVRDFLAAGCRRSRPLWLGVRRGMDERIHATLERISAAGLERRIMGELSGGQIQRVMLAQALLHEPEILLLDEPSSAIDVEGEALFCDLLEEIHTEFGLTTVWISHDLSVITNHAHRVICLKRRLICHGTPEEILTPDRLHEMFGPHAKVYSHHGHSHARPHAH